jgi:hypothetical protein
MNVSALLRRTALRYEQAVSCVLSEWSPPCGCPRPGRLPTCTTCPSLSLFTSRVGEKIQQLALSPAESSPQKENPAGVAGEPLI